jgi:metal-responsive CopG/Arc/MetJ family transcriptional regulator
MNMFGSRVKLDKWLLARVKRAADLAGYSSVEEFITHAIEKELAQLENAETEEEIRRKLKGLGYLS